MKLMEMNMDKIIALCKKYKVAKLWVFGSILTDRFNDNSDVDIVFDDCVKNPYFRKELDSTKKLVYE